MNEEVKKTLEAMADRKNFQFQSRIIPNAGNILGVRMPQLRQYAKELAKKPEIPTGEDFYYEEVMLRGMVIGYRNVPIDRHLADMADFVPKISNWAVCDSFCSTLKFTAKNREQVWTFLQPYARSDKEFAQRFCAVMLLDYFVNEEYIDRTLSLLAEIGTTQYYASMAVAWALAECYIKFPEKTLPCIGSFDEPTIRRTVRKISDSYRVEQEKKQQLKEEFLYDKRNG